jgi:hypothetical protein
MGTLKQYEVHSFGGVAMKIMNLFSAIAFAWGSFFSASSCASQVEHTVYQVYRPVDLGEGFPPPKDIFVSIGTMDGIRKGSYLDVYRRISSFDNLTSRHMGDHMIPVGRLKIIHVDEKTAIARSDRFVSLEEEPALMPQAIMIGDVVRPVR